MRVAVAGGVLCGDSKLLNLPGSVTANGSHIFGEREVRGARGKGHVLIREAVAEAGVLEAGLNALTLVADGTELVLDVELEWKFEAQTHIVGCDNRLDALAGGVITLKNLVLLVVTSAQSWQAGESVAGHGKGSWVADAVL